MRGVLHLYHEHRVKNQLLTLKKMVWKRTGGEDQIRRSLRNYRIRKTTIPGRNKNVISDASKRKLAPLNHKVIRNP